MRSNRVRIKDLGRRPFAEAWKIQQEIHAETIADELHEHTLLFCEHPHVYTLGKSGRDSNLLVGEDLLAEKGIDLFRIDRGGDITYHGPGQVVCYPIFDLSALNIGVRKYIGLLEEAVIGTLREYGLKGERMKGATGVWLDPSLPAGARKICAIGVKVSRSVTMHGLAFNVATHLEYFGYINPCGFTDKTVTSMEKELDKNPEPEEVKVLLAQKIGEVFNLEVFDEDP